MMGARAGGRPGVRDAVAGVLPRGQSEPCSLGARPSRALVQDRLEVASINPIEVGRLPPDHLPPPLRTLRVEAVGAALEGAGILLILSYIILPYILLPYFILPYIILPHLTLPYRIVSHLILPYLTLSI